MKQRFKVHVRLLMIALALILSFSGGASADLTTGLVAYYPFNGNANDESGNGNNGTVNGATLTTDWSGNANSAYSFNGTSSYIVINDAPSLRLLKNYSIFAWVKADNTGAFLTKGATTTLYPDYQLGILAGNTSHPAPFNISSWYEGDNDHSGEDRIISKNTISSDWAFVGVIFEGGNKISLYINGNFDNSAIVNTEQIRQSSYPLYIGAWRPPIDENSVSWLMNGSIDDIRIYNRALSESEIQELYNGQTNTTSTGSLTVTLSPQSAIDSGAQWRVDSGTWQNSGATVSNLTVGSHTVEFKDVTGYTKPSSQTVSIQDGQTATATGAYTLLNNTQAQYYPITFFYNTSNTFLVGNLTFNGVPFNIPETGNNIWDSYSATGTNPRFIDISINKFGITEVHTLINSSYGQRGPNSYAFIEFFGSTGAYLKVNLIGNDNIRDYNQSYWTNTINGITTIEVFNDGSGHRRDKQLFTLPSEFSTQQLEKIRLSDNGGTDFQRVFLTGLTVVSGTPSQTQTGSLTVTLTPQTAIDAGAQWRVDSGTWQNNGATVSNLTVGSHTVEFKDVTGYTKPSSQTVTIQQGQTATATGTYVPVQQNYSLTITATGGTVTKSPDKSSYTSGDVVTLTAIPNSCYTFSGWSGDASGTSTTTTVTMNANKTVTAAFTQSTYTLNITAANGTVTKNPDKTSYACGETVTLTASPAAGYTFGSWSGDASGISTSTTVTMSATKSVTANFSQVQTYTLSKTSSPTAGGSISVSPDKISYTSGETVTITASPNSCYTFSGWSGDASGNSTSTTMTMTSNKSVTASFTQQTYSLTLSATGGTVTKSPNKTLYSCNETVTLTSVPDSCFTFTGWSGDASGTSTTTTVIMSSDKSVTASFSQQTFTLTVNASNGTVTKNPDKTSYSCNESVRLTAVPNTGTTFTNWSGDASGTTTSITVTMTGNKTITANFGSLLSLTKTVNPTDAGTISVTPDKSSYTSGESVKVTFTPNTCYTFSKWSGELSGSVSTMTFTINKNTSITANATQESYSLTVNAENGNVIVTPQKSVYTCNESVSVFAEPDDGYTFTGWSQDASGSANPLSITMNADKSITALFEGAAPTVTPLSIVPAVLSISEASSVHSFTITGGKAPYAATTKNGSASVNQSTVTYTAPNIVTDDVLTVYDATGKSVIASISFSVGNIIMVAIQEKTVSRGEVIELEATGGMSELIWTAPVGGSFIPSDGYKGTSVQFKAPNEVGDYTVTVSDNANNTRNIVIHVRNKPVLSPKYNWINADYKDVTLQVIGGNPPYQWTVDQGNIVPKTDTATAVYSSPRIIDGEATITVTDHSGLQDTATVFINRPMRLRQEFVIAPGKTQEMIVSGGYPPFKWTAITGEFRDKNGNIVSEGETVVYHASDLIQDDTITVVDASGNMCEATVYNRTELSFVTMSKNVQLGDTVTLSIQGGVPPYQWKIDDSAEILGYSGQDNSTADIQVSSIAGPTLSTKKNIITITVTDRVAGHQAQGFLFVMGELRVNPSQNVTIHRGESVKLEVFNGAGNYLAVSDRGYIQSVNQSYNLGIFKYSTVNPETATTNKPMAIPVGQDTITIYDGANTKLTVSVDVVTELDPVITPSTYAGDPGMEITMTAVHGLPPYRWAFVGANGEITPLNEDASVVHVMVSNVTDTVGRVVVTDQFDNQGYAEVITTRPLRITPRAATIFPGEEQTFSALGGLSNYQWELLPMTGLEPIPGAQLSSVTGKNTTFSLPPEVDSGSMLIQLSDSSGAVVTATISISPMTMKTVDKGDSSTILLTFSPNEINTGLIFIRILTPKNRSFFMPIGGIDLLTQELVPFFDLKGEVLGEFQIIPFFGGFLPAIQKEKLKALDGAGAYRLDIVIYDPNYTGNKTEYLEWDGQFIPVVGMVQGSTSILVEE